MYGIIEVILLSKTYLHESEYSSVCLFHPINLKIILQSEFVFPFYGVIKCSNEYDKFEDSYNSLKTGRIRRQIFNMSVIGHGILVQKRD